MTSGRSVVSLPGSCLSGIGGRLKRWTSRDFLDDLTPLLALDSTTVPEQGGGNCAVGARLERGAIGPNGGFNPQKE